MRAKLTFGQRIDNVCQFIRIGSDSRLLGLDLFLLLFVFWDFIKMWTLGLDIYHFSFFRNLWGNFSFPYVLFAVGLIFVPPVVNAVFKFLFRPDRNENDDEKTRAQIPTHYKNVIFAFHFAIAVGFSFFVSISRELQDLSGYRTDRTFSLHAYEYQPAWGVVYGVIGSVLLILVGKFLLDVIWSRKNISKNEFLKWFNLADIAGAFMPQQKSNLIFVNTASMAPSIRWVIATEQDNRNEYQRRVPTSTTAKDFLKKRARESRTHILNYLIADGTREKDFSIEFLPGTSRGLEIGLTQIKNLKQIILSPYEHPSQNNVAEWFALLKRDVSCEMVSLDRSKLTLSWNEQRDWLVGQIKQKLPENGIKVAILLSEVHYETGLHLRVSEVMQKLRPDPRNSNIVFIIDGSQSVGNLAEPFRDFMSDLHGEDFYYFSAHKWLLSPNTCGVIVAKTNADRYPKRPYDLFSEDPPLATIDPGMIFGLHASLEYLIDRDKTRFIDFQKKSSFLKEHFKDKIGDSFEIIEASTPEMNVSNFIALRPSEANGYQWKESERDEFWRKIVGNAVDLTLIPLPDKEGREDWWVRISFPYFLPLRALNRLIKHLKKRVTLINP